MLIAGLFVWQIPPAYGLAQRIPAVETFAHILMMATGLWYFAMLLDPRDPPEGHARGARLMSGFVLIVSNILLGSLTTLKATVIYSEYHSLVRSGTLSPMADETIGGFTIWVPSSMVMILSIILVLNEWNRAEEQRWAMRFTHRCSNSAALEFPETAAELQLKVADPNRQVGRSLALGALAMFCLVMVTAISVLSMAR
jgi:putative membrane protein